MDDVARYPSSAPDRQHRPASWAWLRIAPAGTSESTRLLSLFTLVAVLIALSTISVPLAGRAGSPALHHIVWRLDLVAGVLLAACWRVRGALVGAAWCVGVSLAIQMRSAPAMQEPVVALVAEGCLALLITLVVAWLARRLARYADFEHLAMVQTRVDREAEAAARASEERFHSLLQNASDLMVVLDATGTLRYSSPSVERLLGYPPQNLIGASLFDLVHYEDRVRVLSFHVEQLAKPPLSAPIEFRCRNQRGEWHYLEASFSNLLNDPSVGGIVVNARDVTERVRFQERLTHQAFHDPLTGLPNRALFLDRLERALARGERSFRSTAVMFLDLDRFKVINDTLGHAAGDALLIEVGRRVSTCLRGSDSVARLGGDEFAVLVEEVTHEDEAVTVAERILASLQQAVQLGDGDLFVGTSIGIALSSKEHARPADLLQEADIALYRAKASGRGCYAVFDPSMNADVMERLDLETDLRRALERDELRLYYQPIVALTTGRLREVEVLVRWEHPTKGLILPNQFIPLAEETGLIVPLGRWVLEEACRQAAAWQGEHSGIPPVLSVNLSARQFRHPRLVEDVMDSLAASGLGPEALKLEITETTVMEDAAQAAETLARLRAMGVQLAIDDFGTGYSSLSYLKRFPVNTLKIDRSFIDGLATDPNDAAIVRSVIALAKSMGLQVTGEGVETTEQLARLRELGCDQGQGYLFARPLTAEDVADLLPHAATETLLAA